MSDEINYDGITVRTREELKEALERALKDIYGQDISLSQDSPDGQMVNIYVQKGIDDRELTVQVYNSFDPNAAIGKSLDRIAAINGVRRKAGSHTLVDITIDTDAPVVLHGLDQTDQEVFTVEDDTGNKFFLVTSQRIRSNQSVTTRFQAEEIGAVITERRTITTISTPVVGVTNVNNLLDTTITGSNEESDFSLRTRRALAVSRPATGFIEALRSDLLSLEGVETAVVHENENIVVDSNGVPPHSIWVILKGTASSDDIASTIYRKRGTGTNMRGSITHSIQTIDGTGFTAKWDTPLVQKAFLFAAAASRDSNAEIDYNTLKDDLFSSVTTGIGSELNYNQIFCDFIFEQNQPLILNNGGLSTGHTQNFTLLRNNQNNATKTQGGFTISYNGNQSDTINHNDNRTQVRSKITAVTGLSNAVVSFTSDNIFSVALPSTGLVEDLIRTKNLTMAGPDIQIDVEQTQGGTVEINASPLFIIQNQIPSSEIINTIGGSHEFSLTKDRMVIEPIKIFGVPSFLIVEDTMAENPGFTVTSDGGFGSKTYFIGISSHQPLSIPQAHDDFGSINPTTGIYSVNKDVGTRLTRVYVFAVDELGNYATTSFALDSRN